ncbi:DUF4136 domain-containing protein [[Enterobacter] lignolyticus]|uniref:Lipoprotein n=1 Tax=Enterobacter lignolyticus (strain SCF1) TaxID=701347 RepID=E3GBL5_ENTLS|nr:DUF4136 domain-containing protein [[Enterobacter] lignolyticus]ADO50057.1 putative lipoprotein [[Enterobacter] lignolyticus SCF1]
MRIGHSVSCAVLCFTLAGCASPPEIQSDYDRAVNFQQYHTWNFAPPAAGSYLTIQQRYLQSAVSYEMTKLGYQRSNQPDLAVNASLLQQKEIEQEFVPAYAGWGGAWDWETYDQTPVDWTHNSLSIDVVDVHKKQQIWQGSMSQFAPGDDNTLTTMDIQHAVAKIFERYPTAALPGK